MFHPMFTIVTKLISSLGMLVVAMGLEEDII
jgi:hypothetical protein